VLNGKSISPKEPTELGQMSWKWSCSCPPMEQLLEALHSKSAHWGKNVALEVWYIKLNYKLKLSCNFEDSYTAHKF